MELIARKSVRTPVSFQIPIKLSLYRGEEGGGGGQAAFLLLFKNS